jgi:hypothetical protein
MKLEEAFRQLRTYWFKAHLLSVPHEREWEDEDRMQLRDQQNQTTRKKFDQHTEEIITGHYRPLAPRCGYDLEQINE